MPIARFRGTHLYYERRGTGPPLVLLLPQSSGPAGRQALIAGLAEQHEVITYEQRGCARSAPAPPVWSIGGLGEDVAGLLEALKLEPVSLVCHSTGCGIGLSLATTCPQHIDAVVLATPWSHADVHLHSMQTLRKSAARALDPAQYARFNAALLFPPAFRRANETGFTRMADEAPARPQDADDIARRLDAILAFDARPLWPKVRCPTLVVSAKDDQLMPPWFASDTAAGIRGAELVEFDGGGHMLPETRTGEFLAIVLGFLARVARRSAT